MSETTTAIDPDLHARVLDWLHNDPDEHTRTEVQALLDANDVRALTEQFGARLEFGTAGLRGLLGGGPNRMNRAVVIRTTAGLCDWIRARNDGGDARGVVIGYDGRHYSREFAEDAAAVCAGYGVKAYLYTIVCPTPVLAFAVLQLGAAAGVMVTASHNPPKYNGYKVYASHGGQIVPPDDVEIAAAIDRVGALREVPRPILKEARARGLVSDVEPAVERAYLDAVKGLSHRPEGAPASDLVIAYTPMHGVGDRLAHAALAQSGFANVHSVPEQAEPDGDFPTVAFPNPEEKGAMDLVLALARKENAGLVLANDPDADRLAVAVPDGKGGYTQLSGNDVGALLAHYLLTVDRAPAPKRLVINSIVSSPLLGTMAQALGVRHEEVLTGFKWIAHRARELEASDGCTFVFGFEEALGYTAGTVVRDKDGVSSAALFAEMTDYVKATHGRDVLAQLDAIFRAYGVFVSGQFNVTAQGLDGAKKLGALMSGFRAHPPARIGSTDVTVVTDLSTGVRTRPGNATTETVNLPASNVIVYGLGDGSRITLRPSGTEPKIKYYFDVREEVAESEPVATARARAESRLNALRTAFVAMAEGVASP